MLDIHGSSAGMWSQSTYTSDSLLLPWRPGVGRGRERNSHIFLGEMSVRILSQAFLLLVGQVTCREIVFFARVPITFKKTDKTQKYSGMLLILLNVL